MMGKILPGCDRGIGVSVDELWHEMRGVEHDGATHFLNGIDARHWLENHDGAQSAAILFIVPPLSAELVHDRIRILT